MIQPFVHSAMLSHNTLECVIEALPSGIILLDANRRIVAANPMGRVYLGRLTHCKVGDLLTQLGRHALPSPAAIDHLPSKLCNQGTPLASYAISVCALSSTTDRSRWMIVLQETTEQDTVLQALRRQFVQSNTDRLRLEKQLRASKSKLYKLAAATLAATQAAPTAIAPAAIDAHAQEELMEMGMLNAQLARAVRLKDQFWGHMSHELRTPLSSILLNGELLQRNLFGTLTPKQTQYVQRMVDSTNHLLALINDILDLTCTDAGYTELSIANADIQRLCLTSIEMVKEQAHLKRIPIAFEWDEEAASLQVDEARFKQILVNLLTNAVKFTPERGKIGLKVTVDRATDAVYFAVWDTGVGIAEADIPRLFQRFVKLDTGSLPRVRSAGLGLALVVQLARLHGGNLNVNSTLGNGSCFTVGLPWTSPISAQVPSDLLPRNASFVHQLSDTAHQLASALVEQNVCLIIDRQLDDVAGQVQRLAPDLIFLDLTIEDATGWQLLPALVQAAKAQNIPVIVLDDINVLAYTEHTGADLCLGKPLTCEHVRSALSTVLPQGSFLRTALLMLPATARKSLGRILIIEDMRRTSTVLVDYLFAMGYDVALATTQITALTLAQKIQPHLVLMDLQMPGIDCAQTIQQLRALPNLHALPVIGLTALTLPGDQECIWAAGMNGYLSKPYDLAKLLATVEQLLPHLGSR